MVVAGWAAHRPNGFFIFRDGYEYVLVVANTAAAIAILGPGGFSLDAVFGVVNYDHPAHSGLVGLAGGLVAVTGGLIGGVLLLALGWRPKERASR
jgi:putative oxidoreductase